LGFSSVNLFGAMGAAPIFNFYMADEFSHSVETQFIFPKGEDISWGLRSLQSAFFYGFSGAEFALDNSLTLNSSNRVGEGISLTDSLSAAWTIPAKKTLLGTIYAALAGMARRQSSWLTLANIAESEYELFRKESLEFILEKPSGLSEGSFSLVMGHESIVRIFGRLSLTAFAKLRVSENLGTNIFTMMGSIGTSLNLIF
jgi:hypothetical protein